MQKNGQCRNIRFPVSRHYVEKVLTLLQCCDIAMTSAEKGKAKICQCHNIITTLSRYQVNVATTQLNVATSKATSIVKLHQTSNVVTSPRLYGDIKTNLNQRRHQLHVIETPKQCRDIRSKQPEVKFNKPMSRNRQQD